jgi:XTP/dITP diphosphohydrolase
MFARRGTHGFGYDPLFEVIEYHRTFGELSSLVKTCLSHRARAARQLIPQLMELVDTEQLRDEG